MGEGEGGELVGLFEEAGPVFDGADEGAAVDVVEGLSVGPVFFEIVDFEFYVFGDPA